MNDVDRADLAVRSPLWLRLLLGLELLSWLLWVAMGLLFAIVVTTFGHPEGALLGVIEGLGVAACLANVVILGRGLFRRRPEPLARRFAVIHATTALVATIPVGLALLGLTVYSLFRGQLGDALQFLPMALLVPALPAVALLLCRRDEGGAMWIGVVLSVLSCLGSALVLVAMMVSFAVTGGLTV